MMTGTEFANCRKSCDLTQSQWGRALGYNGINADVTVRRYENGTRPIPNWIARLAFMYQRNGIPTEFLD